MLPSMIALILHFCQQRCICSLYPFHAHTLLSAQRFVLSGGELELRTDTGLKQTGKRKKNQIQTLSPGWLLQSTSLQDHKSLSRGVQESEWAGSCLAKVGAAFWKDSARPKIGERVLRKSCSLLSYSMFVCSCIIEYQKKILIGFCPTAESTQMRETVCSFSDWVFICVEIKKIEILLLTLLL